MKYLRSFNERYISDIKEEIESYIKPDLAYIVNMMTEYEDKGYRLHINIFFHEEGSDSCNIIAYNAYSTESGYGEMSYHVPLGPDSYNKYILKAIESKNIVYQLCFFEEPNENRLLDWDDIIASYTDISSFYDDIVRKLSKLKVIEKYNLNNKMIGVRIKRL